MFHIFMLLRAFIKVVIQLSELETGHSHGIDQIRFDSGLHLGDIQINMGFICLKIWLRPQAIFEAFDRDRDFTFTFHFHAPEKEMATQSSVLAWRIPGTGSLVGCLLWGCTELDMTETT